MNTRWFQFRLRTLLIAVAVLAVPCAWVSYSLQWIRQRHDILAIQPRRVYGRLGPLMPERTAPGGLWLFGEQGQKVLFYEANWSEDRLVEMERLFPEAWLVEVKAIEDVPDAFVYVRP